MHLLEKVDEESADKVHGMNNMLGESFTVEDCNRKIVVNGFG